MNSIQPKIPYTSKFFFFVFLFLSKQKNNFFKDPNLPYISFNFKKKIFEGTFITKRIPCLFIFILFFIVLIFIYFKNFKLYIILYISLEFQLFFFLHFGYLLI
jgi:hypothetical protein